VIVTELDPIKALQALHDGYRVQSLVEAAPLAEVVFSSTGIRGAMPEAILEVLPDGAIICTAGGGPYELPMEKLHSLGTAQVVRASVVQYVMPSGRSILVLGEGECLNCSDAEGNPIEVMDLSLSLQALAVEQIIADAHTWEPGVYPISEQSEQEVARIRLGYEGATVEPLTPELTSAMSSW
jgi:adenosylhomocysteinase